MTVLQRLPVTLIVLVALLLATPRLHGETPQAGNRDKQGDQAASGAAPDILSHSTENFAIYQADKFVLDVTPGDPSAHVAWSRNGVEECHSLQCSFDTASWSVGSHTITAVVANNVGFRAIRFQIQILNRPGGIPIQTIIPGQSTTLDDSDQIAIDDLSVQAIVGTGYRFADDSTDLVEKTRQKLEWNERLKSGLDGILHFGRPGTDQHYLLENSSCLLTTSTTGQRVIVLTAGILRSRSLAQNQAKWSIAVDSWLQIDGNNNADVIVKRPEKSDEPVSIIVLRGQVLLRKRSKSKSMDADQSSSSAVVLQGGAIETRENDREFTDPAAPLSGPVSKVITKTTPEYLLIARPDKRRVNSKTQQGRPSTDQNRSADEAIAKRDYFSALTILMPYSEASTKEYDLAMRLGRASKGIFLYEQAAEFFTEAARLKPRKADPPFELGEMYLNDSRWEAAIAPLSTAAENNYPNKQLMDYYRGVAEFYSGDKILSSHHFRYSLWESGDKAISRSAKNFVGKIRSESVFDVRFGAGAFYDSNILRKASGTDLPASIPKGEDQGYLANFGFSLIVFEFWRGTWFFSYDIEQRIYATKDLAEMAATRQIVASNLFFKGGGSEIGDPIVELGAKPYLEMFFLGNERAMDSVGIDFYFTLSNLWASPSLHYDGAVRMDPYPGREDIYDPILEGMAPATDRSNRYGAIALYLKPYMTDNLAFDFGVKSGVTRYRDASASDDSFTDTRYRLGAEYDLNQRNQVSSALDFRHRYFFNADDERADKLPRIDAAWKFSYTPNFFQTLTMSYERANSTRSGSSYSRSNVDFSVELAF